MKDAYKSKHIPILIKCFLLINAVFVKALILNISIYVAMIVKMKTSVGNKQFLRLGL